MVDPFIVDTNEAQCVHKMMSQFIEMPFSQSHFQETKVRKYHSRLRNMSFVASNLHECDVDELDLKYS